MLEVAAQHGFRFDAVLMPSNLMDAHFRSFCSVSDAEARGTEDRHPDDEASVPRRRLTA